MKKIFKKTSVNVNKKRYPHFTCFFNALTESLILLNCNNATVPFWNVEGKSKYKIRHYFTSGCKPPPGCHFEFFESHISRQNYFRRIEKYGEELRYLNT